MSLPISLLLIPLILQGLCMLIDEAYFHYRRGLPTWERWGHPLDTLTVLAAYLFLLLNPKTEMNTWIYAGLAVGSCLFITKDEWVHAELCSGAESWLHAILFVLHPIVFLSAGIFWWREEILFIRLQAFLTTGFLIYQLLRWNISWQKAR